MPDPIRRQSPPPPQTLGAEQLDAHTRAATGGRDDVSLNRAIRPAERESAAGALAHETAIEAVAHALEHAAAHAGSGVAATLVGAGGIMLPPLAMGAELVGKWAEAHEEGDRQNQVFHQDRMHGALAYMAGYANAPEILAEAAERPGVAEGLRRARAFHMDSANAGENARMARAIQHQASLGEAAVLDGRADDAACRRRCERDPAFRLGVEHMEALRERDPEAFAAAVAERREAVAEIRAAQHAQVRP